MYRVLTALVTAAALASGIAGAKADTFADILKTGVVRIAVPLDVPPFGSMSQERKPEGFDIDLAQMVGKSLGVKVELQQVTAANRIPYLLTDKVDVVISVLGLTPERAKQIMFTAPYADTNLAVYGPKSTAVKSAAELGSLRVVAAKGTTQDLGLSEMNPQANIMRTEDDATAATAYITGQADLFATNSLIIPDMMKRAPNKEFDLKFVIRRSPAHMGVKMGEFALLQWLNSFIFFNTMNGELDKLHRKWLNAPMAPLPTL
ncbi:MAG TPA: transporter substrate-binding domain-containing protein [Hyphomicrobiaceae bacterium]|jgi:polar amino acid transport system substrate-binding protein